MKWIVSTDILSLELQNGNVAVTSAKQIYLAEFTGKSLFNDIEITNRPSHDLPNISFSRYPLDLFILVNPPRAEHTQPAKFSIVGIRNDKRIHIELFSATMPDHILHENSWYPLVRDSIQEIAEIMAQNNISGPGILSLKQYLELKKHHADSLIVEENEDVCEIKAESTEENAPPLFVGNLYPYQRNGYNWLAVTSQVMARENIAKVLGCRVKDGLLTENEAIKIAKRWFYDNPKELYQLKI